MRILVTGGMGYIGSHTLVELLADGLQAVSIDNLCNSSEQPLKGIKTITGTDVANHRVDVRDRVGLGALLQSLGKIDGVVHFAALKAVGESMDYPLRYYENNITSLLNVLDICQQLEVPLIFSSSCTVYGTPRVMPVVESAEHRVCPSVYGRTKQMCERIIMDSASQLGIKSVLLRYFNPAGAHHSAMIGESPINTPQNLVPAIIEVAAGRRDTLTVFGDDYDTRDGTCVRDYLHVSDLARAHVAALKYALTQQQSPWEAFNLGTGTGTSVLESIAAFERISGLSLPYKIGPRRIGDIPSIYADASQAAKKLGFRPSLGIDDIMSTAWAWEKSDHRST